MTYSNELSFGKELRRERLIREISLEEISAETKISVRLLEALENSDFSRLPAPIFTRGFIRAYARHIGVDPEEKVCAYLADLAASSPEATVARARVRGRFRRGRGATAGAIVGGVATVLLLLGLIARPARRSPQREVLRMAPRAAAVAFKNVSVSSEPTPVICQEADAGIAARSTAAAVVTLVLEFEQDSWAKLEAPGETLLIGLVRRGEVKRFEGRGGFRLSLGNAGGVRVTIDGRALERLGRPGEVVRDRPLPFESARG